MQSIVTGYEDLLVSIDDKIATITLNRPDKLNALTEPMTRGLQRALEVLDEDAGISVIILKGAGRAFCAGYDITPTAARTAARASRDIIADREKLRHTVARWLTIWDLRIPVIAQVHGYCLAGGSELALLCDLIVAAQDAQIGHPAVRSMGVPPTNIYPYAFGLRKAKQMVLTGDTIAGARAAELGIVNWSAAADDLDRFTLEIARRIARIPRDMLTLNKRAVNRAYELMGFRAGVEIGIEYDAMAHFTPPAVRFWETAEREGLRAALAERDRPFTAEGGGR